mgnify:CR=1 FL=1
MSKNEKNWGILVILCVVIITAVSLTVRRVAASRHSDAPNPNVTLVTAPDQTDFEEHPEWTVPETEPIDYGENIALEKAVRQNGQTQIYNCRNVNDGDRFTYWEGAADAYPNEVTIDMGEPMEMTGARILLNPRQIWGARTQKVEVLISDDGENFTTVYEKTTLSFDPMADNSVYMPFPETVTGQYIQFRFYSNSGASAGQAAEIDVYGAK